MSSRAELKIRAANAADEAFLFRLYASTRADEVAATGWPAAQQERFLREQFGARQRSYRTSFPSAVCSIVVVDRVARGAVIVQRSDAEIRLIDIALLPDSRGQGLGSRLLKPLVEEASKAGKPLRLQVLKENQAAFRLYLRLGFEPVADNGAYLKMEWHAAAGPVDQR
jgi:ribosomal protein S18 acetylase RimI-like enzyme